MSSQTQRQPDHGAVRQFSVFVENKVGRLSELIESLAQADVHILAMCLVDSTDSTIIRMVLDQPEAGERVMDEHLFAHDVNGVLAIEMASEASLKEVADILLRAEINILYLYPFLMRPSGRCGLVLRADDQDLAGAVLQRHGITVLGQADLAR
jgi:hypothetical protein